MASSAGYIIYVSAFIFYFKLLSAVISINNSTILSRCFFELKRFTPLFLLFSPPGFHSFTCFVVPSSPLFALSSFPSGITTQQMLILHLPPPSSSSSIHLHVLPNQAHIVPSLPLAPLPANSSLSILHSLFLLS